MPTFISSTICFLALVLASWWLGVQTIKILPASIPAPRLFLALPLGVMCFLVSFANFAHLFTSYWISLPLSILLPGLILKRVSTSSVSEVSSSERASWCCIALCAFVGVVTIAMHSQWPSLHWENSGDKVGVEKLFNLSLQQSFLFGSTYPPEWIWLSGEKSHYYLLPKAFPGLASWLTRVLFLDAQSGGYHFIFAGGFFNGLAAGCCAGWTITLLGFFAPRSALASRIFVGILLGALSFTCTHYFGLKRGLESFFGSTPLSWWELQEQVVHYTQNQYPVWLIMLGDNHAYSQVMASQLSLWALTAILCTSTIFSVSLIVLTALVAATVYLSHAPSVLLDFVTLVPGIAFVLLVESIRRNFAQVWAVMSNVVGCGVVTLIFIFLNSTLTGDTKWVIPPADVVSPLFSFLSVQFWPLIWCSLLAAVCILARRISSQGLAETWQVQRGTLACEVLEWCIIPVVLGLVLGVLTGRPALTVTGVCMSALLILATASKSGEVAMQQRSIAILAACAFGIWVLPEFLAIDNRADNRTLWIRFNIVLRFWPEGYYLIPFVATAACAAPLMDALGPRWWRSRSGCIFAGCAVPLLTLFSLSHIPGAQDRAARIGTAPTPDGFHFVSLETPADSEIIKFLASLPASPAIVIGEACGTWRYQGVPVNYAWPGRISVFSGRHAVCGWTRHAELHQPMLEHPWRGSSVTRDRFVSYENALLVALKASGAALPSWNSVAQAQVFGDLESVESAKRTLRELGVTHLVFGEREAQAYGEVSLQALAAAVGGKVGFKVFGRELGVVELY